MQHPEIPKGYYCYSNLTVGYKPADEIHVKLSEIFGEPTSSVMPVFHTTNCPYWGSDPNQESQNSGFCTFLNTRDWDDSSGGLLWDQVKDCGINVDYEDNFGNKDVDDAG